MSTDSWAQTEKRRDPRRRVLKGAQIAFGGLNLTRDCVVRDISDIGARLNLETSAGIPPYFYLLLEGTPMRACHMIWRHATQIGVEFIPENGSGACAGIRKPGKM